MSKKPLELLFLAFLTLAGCGDNNNIISEDDLAKGVIDGIGWIFSTGTADFDIQNSKYTITLMNEAEGANTDPCAVVFPDQQHVRFTVPAQLGNYPLPISPSAEGVKFYAGVNTNNFVTATSGFVQITGVSSVDIQGIIQADFDSQNKIEGLFIVPVCN